MLQKGMTIREAAEQWINGFDAIQLSMISKLMSYEPDDWEEVTKPAIGDRVYAYQFEQEGTIKKTSYEIQYENGQTETGRDQCLVELDCGKETWIDNDEFEFVRVDSLPMWGTMWSFHDRCDNYWLENMDGIQALSDCGFQVYCSNEFGYFFGIDGAGYDFFESHWIPLYRKRGLQWHDPETEESVGK